MAMIRRDIPLNLPMQINIVDVRDVAEAHVRALREGGRRALPNSFRRDDDE